MATKLGKLYRLGATAGSSYQYRLLREAITSRFKGAAKNGSPNEQRLLWALRNVSFDVSEGEKVGIIGRNGAGKSTLLKILSRVTMPTEGRAQIRGRVGALLEVGSGFHPELSGRDNIFLNGAILGMGKQEIREKVDQITEFAGIERFLNTPVKRYSSGMHLRLAFAVAAHLEADILILDEVLAVGDAEFQKKCLGRMAEFGESGRTVIFVSHSMPAILRLCERVILLDQGGIVADGTPQNVIGSYLNSGLGTSAERVWHNPETAPGDEVVRLKAVRVRSLDNVTEEIDIRNPIEIEIEYWQLVDSHTTRPSANLHFTNEEGILLFMTNDSNNQQWRRANRKRGVVSAVCEIPGNFLAEGRHFVLAAVSSFNPTKVHVAEKDAVSFQVVDRTSGDGVRGEYANEWPGAVRPMLQWKVSLK